MIYAESFRHFIEEWIRIEPPKRHKGCPWGDKLLYLLNLYAYSSPTYFTERPKVFCSILLDGDFVEEQELIGMDRALYRGYFTQTETGSFMLPRRYLLCGRTNSGTTFKLNRYHFTSDGYDNMALHWDKPDLKLIEYLETHRHIRRDPEGEFYQYLKNRLEHLGERDLIRYPIGDTLLDATTVASEQLSNHEAKASPATMIIGMPFYGTLIGEIRGVIDYTLMKQSEKITPALSTEPCSAAYQVYQHPFHGKVSMRAYGPETDWLFYLIAESTIPIINIEELDDKCEMNSGDMMYNRMLVHSFSADPIWWNGELKLRLMHQIRESLIQKKTPMWIRSHLFEPIYAKRKP